MIRKATLEDIPWLVDLALPDMFELLGNTSMFNRHYQETVLLPALIQHHIVFVEERKGAIIGSVIPHPFNPDIVVASELMWWVHKDKRNSPLGYKLLRLFEQEAKEKRATYISMSLLPTSPVKSLQRLGYIQKELAFLKEL